jgi:hypothetical protein
MVGYSLGYQLSGIPRSCRGKKKSTNSNNNRNLHLFMLQFFVRNPDGVSEEDVLRQEQFSRISDLLFAGLVMETIEPFLGQVVTQAQYEVAEGIDEPMCTDADIHKVHLKSFCMKCH